MERSVAQLVRVLSGPEIDPAAETPWPKVMSFLEQPCLLTDGSGFLSWPTQPTIRQLSARFAPGHPGQWVCLQPSSQGSGSSCDLVSCPLHRGWLQAFPDKYLEHWTQDLLPGEPSLQCPVLGIWHWIFLRSLWNVYMLWNAFLSPFVADEGICVVSNLFKETHNVTKLRFKSSSVWFQRLCFKKSLMYLFLAWKDSFLSQIEQLGSGLRAGSDPFCLQRAQAASAASPLPLAFVH